VIRAAAILILATALLAQGPNARYDAQRKVKLEGPVTRIEWVNPRAFVFVDARDASGTITNWAVEIGNPLELERGGWKKSTLRIGDIVTVDGTSATGQTKQALAASIIAKASGRRIFAAAPGKVASYAATPRWPDGHVRLGPAPGKKGYWGRASVNGFFEETRNPPRMNEEALLTSLGDADRVAPFKPWAKSVYQFRQRSQLVDDPIRGCVPPGGPRQFHSANGFQFIEQPELGRILVLHGGGNRNWRVIYTDGRPQGQAAEVVLSYFGNSVGKWEGDTLVVDSVGFNERFWFANGGLPHTEALHLVERFTRADMNTLRYEVTVDDTRTYTRPWKASWTIQWVPDEEIQEYFCEENAESTFIR
jgi:hypothetical protein